MVLSKLREDLGPTNEWCQAQLELLMNGAKIVRHIMYYVQYGHKDSRECARNSCQRQFSQTVFTGSKSTQIAHKLVYNLVTYTDPVAAV